MSDTETTDAVEIPESDQPSEDGAVVAPHAPLDPAPTTDGTDPGEPAAQVASDTNTNPAPPAQSGVRAAPSDLEGDLRKVLDDYVSGKLTLPEGSLPTPHTLASEIAKLRNDGKKVSSGAVSAALARWEEIGFATLGTKPTVFIDYTDAARNEGLSALKAKNRANKGAARKAAKEPEEVGVNPTVNAAPAEPLQTETVAENVEVINPTGDAAETFGTDAEGYADPAIPAQQHDPAPTTPATPY
jgi:hypothetical protein